MRIRDLDGPEALSPLNLRDMVGGIIRKPIQKKGNSFSFIPLFCPSCS